MVLAYTERVEVAAIVTAMFVALLFLLLMYVLGTGPSYRLRDSKGHNVGRKKP